METGRGGKLYFYAFLAIVVIFQNYWEKKWFAVKLLAVLLICMRVLYIWQAFNKI